LFTTFFLFSALCEHFPIVQRVTGKCSHRAELS
jgi:hypothetical protein